MVRLKLALQRSPLMGSVILTRTSRLSKIGGQASAGPPKRPHVARMFLVPRHGTMHSEMPSARIVSRGFASRGDLEKKPCGRNKCVQMLRPSLV